MTFTPAAQRPTWPMRWRLVLAGGIVAFGALSLLVGVWVGGTANDYPDQVSSAVDPAVIPQIGGDAQLDYSLPAAEPAALSWNLVDLGRAMTQIPVSVEHGPLVTDPGEWSGWAQTPTGALLAGWTIQQAAGTTDNAALTAYWTQQGVTDPETLNLSVDTRPMDAPKIEVTPLGFELIEYSPVEVTLRYATGYEWGSQRIEESGTATVRWLNGDWRLMMQADNRPLSQELSTEWPYIPWGP